jgi:NAD(P)H-nitrite reductase large subunit
LIPKQYLLIGASAASFGALHSLRRLDTQACITIISAEPELPYNKCLLADYLAGGIDQEALSIYPHALENVNLITGQKVITLDGANKSVITDAGQSFAYDALFLGMGSSPWIPPIPGIESQGVFTFHTNGDANEILAYVKKNAVKKAVVIGAGLSGLEAADALIRQQLVVTIIERSGQVLPTLLCQSSANFLQSTIVACGAKLMLNARVTEIISENDRITGVQIDGEIEPADLIIIATGLKPNTQLCEPSGILLDEHGIVVNEFLQTSIPDVYAGGDLIGVYDQLSEQKLRSCLWPDAMQQGMHAGMAMAGKPKAYAGMYMIVSTAFFGIKYARAGTLQNSSGERIVKTSTDYHHTFSVQYGVLKAFQVLGNQHNLGALRRLLLTRQPVNADQLTKAC